MAFETTSRRLDSIIRSFARWSPRSIRLASSISSTAVSSGRCEMSRRKSCSESLVASAIAAGVEAGHRLVGAPGGVEQLDAAPLGLGVERVERALLELELLDGRGDLAELEGALVLSLLEQRVKRRMSGETRPCEPESPG